MGRKLSFYKKVRNAVLATNKRTDNSIITACNIVMPSVLEIGSIPSEKNNTRKRSLVKGRVVNLNRTTADRRKSNK